MFHRSVKLTVPAQIQKGCRANKREHAGDTVLRHARPPSPQPHGQIAQLAKADGLEQRQVGVNVQRLGQGRVGRGHDHLGVDQPRVVTDVSQDDRPVSHSMSMRKRAATTPPSATGWDRMI